MVRSEYRIAAKVCKPLTCTHPSRSVTITPLADSRAAVQFDERLRDITPGQAAIFVIFFPSNTVDGKRVYFVERDADVVASAEKGTRISSLLVRSDDSGSTTR